MAKKRKVKWRLMDGQYTCGGIRILPGGSMSFPAGTDPNDHFAGSTWERSGKDEEPEEEIKVGGTNSEEDGPNVPTPPPPEKQPERKL